MKELTHRQKVSVWVRVDTAKEMYELFFEDDYVELCEISRYPLCGLTPIEWHHISAQMHACLHAVFLQLLIRSMDIGSAVIRLINNQLVLSLFTIYMEM